MEDAGREMIAAVVVTYNRKALLARCLAALRDQSHPLDAIFVIDNCSTDGTYDDLLTQGHIAPIDAGESIKTVPLTEHPERSIEIRYVHLPENTGGAGGFHEGIKRAVAAGFDWLWLMDDDLLTTAEALAALVAKKDALAAASDRPFLLNSLVLSEDHQDGDTLAFPLQELSEKGLPKLRIYHWHLSEVRDQVRDGLYRWACPFNGTFVPAGAIAQIGLPNKDFFIKGDEKDFLWRAARVLDIYTVVDSPVYHRRPVKAAFDWRQYYHIRNMLVVNRHFNFTRLRNFKVIVWALALGLRHGRRGLALVVRAIADGRAGRLGRREEIHA